MGEFTKIPHLERGGTIRAKSRSIIIRRQGIGARSRILRKSNASQLKRWGQIAVAYRATGSSDYSSMFRSVENRQTINKTKREKQKNEFQRRNQIKALHWGITQSK